MEDKLSEFVNGLIEENKKLSVDCNIKDEQIKMLLKQLNEWGKVFSDHIIYQADTTIVDLRNDFPSNYNGGVNG